MGSVASATCIRWWYTRSRGGAGATNGTGIIGGTSKGTSSTVEEKKRVVSKNGTSIETRYH